MIPGAFNLQLQDETYLTVVVNSEGHIGSDDVIEANLAVLRGAVGIQGLHAHDPVKQTPFRDRSLVATLHEHGGELVDVVHTDVHGGPSGSRSGKQNTSRVREGEIIVTTGVRNGISRGNLRNISCSNREEKEERPLTCEISCY